MISKIQQQIINQGGNLIVEASAGTGKTHTMVNKIIKDIEHHKSHRSVAAITFTIKAAQEIKNRLNIDTSQHFIGTNNSFVIEEVINPFMKDVYGLDFDKDIGTDYSVKRNSFEEAIDILKNEDILCSYNDNKKNFIFELAQDIAKKSQACKLYLQAKYFKLYIDEYQDCDKDMHNFFMYLCDELNIETFIVGDAKQSIYTWRGAYPDAFKSILEKGNFNKIIMGDNFRSCMQIQNYSNLLFTETKSLYKTIDISDNIIVLSATEANWVERALTELDISKKFAVLRFSNADASNCANLMTKNGLECVYIPRTPITDITTDTAWLYMSIAKFLIIEKYSIYDFVSEIPVEGNESKNMLHTIKNYLNNIETSIDSKKLFCENVKGVALYLGYEVKDIHMEKLHETVKESKFHIAFQEDLYQNIAITFHASKGLEFEQVILFIEDYSLSDMSSICNHYVAVTRAKNKLIIVNTGNDKAKEGLKKLTDIFKSNSASISELLLMK